MIKPPRVPAPPKVPPAQLELGLAREKEQDRNYHLGGRSFYFFDFDDNIAFLTTPLIVFHKETGAEVPVSTGEFATVQNQIGQSGKYKNYELRWDDRNGSFRNFRDHQNEEIEKLGKKSQPFLEDVAQALGHPDFSWKGPSWSCFYHAVFNHRPISVITARGHHPSTIEQGIQLFCEAGHLPEIPNFLCVFPVNHPEVRKFLGQEALEGTQLSVPELKQAAIRKSVEAAIEKYGYNQHHRFGMSDDDPKNIQLIAEEMTRLKVIYPSLSFYVIETHGGDFIKYEVHAQGLKRKSEDGGSGQGSLFD